MFDLWSLFMGGTTEDNFKQPFDRKKAVNLILGYTLFVLSFPVIYLLISYLVQR